MFKKILVAVDMSKMSEEVFYYGCSLAFRLGAEATFLHVLPHPTLWRGYEPWLPPEIDVEVSEIARKKLDYYFRKAKENHPELEQASFEMVVKEGNPSDVIINYAKENDMHLIVIGTGAEHARTLVWQHRHQVEDTALSVLIFRPGEQVI